MNEGRRGSTTTTYRMTKPTLALLADADGGGYVARPVEEGTYVQFDPYILLSPRVLVDVLWDNHPALMFAVDLRTIAVRLK
jgi:hypothetical protein